ncbi:MAG: hypothetical protein QOF72_494 [Blastocatellia bacterium]|jgi:hypothetical protein|nr:hypothetical protein [Blastocatellia bacterium]
MNLKRFMFLLVATVFCAAVFFSSSANQSTAHAEDFDNPKPGAVKWKVIDYNRIQTHPARIPYKIPGGIAFDFLNTPDTALLGTSHASYKGDLLGDMTGKTISAMVGVTVTPGTVFTYYGEPDGCGTPASVRFYFQTDTSGKFDETDYWWSNPVSINLQTLEAGQPASFPLSAPISDPSMWSDYYGHFGSSPAYTAAFQRAVQDVQFIGLSFGGGCGFENGVGVATGGGNFRLMDFSATP